MMRSPSAWFRNPFHPALHACRGMLRIVDRIEDASILHFSSPLDPILNNPLFDLSRKTIVTEFQVDPAIKAELTPSLLSRAKNWHCVAPSNSSAQKLRELGLENVVQIPLVFPRKNISSAAKARKRYTIGWVATGMDTQRTAPDLLFAIVYGLNRRIGENQFDIALAGKLDVIQSAADKLAHLGLTRTYWLDEENFYQNVDICIVTNRWEGHDTTVLDAVATKTKVLSTDVGNAEEILEGSSIFRTISEAIDMLEADFKTGVLNNAIDVQWERMNHLYGSEKIQKTWTEFYSQILTKTEQLFSLPTEKNSRPAPAIKPGPFAKTMATIANNLSYKPKSQKTITIWGEIVNGPYGGGSQFLKALRKELQRRGYRILVNSYQHADGHIMNSRFFDARKVKAVVETSFLKTGNRPRVVHRIDGPVSIYRASSRQVDDLIFDLNRDLATSTVFQSIYSLQKSMEMGYDPIRPTIIRNACDPELFYPREGIAPHNPNKIKLISTSWSNNMKKGFDAFKYLDETLDFNRYEYEFVGRSPFEFKNIKIIPPLASQDLGERLRNADIYIFASVFDAASNALLEAITCGLPTIYVDSGGNKEFTWYSGIKYREKEEIPALLDKVVADYESYRIRNYVKTIQEVADFYLGCLEL